MISSQFNVFKYKIHKETPVFNGFCSLIASWDSTHFKNFIAAYVHGFIMCEMVSTDADGLLCIRSFNSPSRDITEASVMLHKSISRAKRTFRFQFLLLLVKCKICTEKLSLIPLKGLISWIMLSLNWYEIWPCSL